MSQFDNVSVVKQANVYFDGKVTSRTVLFPNGSRQTLGIMLPGDYQFGTEQNERIEILAGALEVKLPGANQWRSIRAGDVFEVPAKTKFDLKVTAVTDYCCAYFD